MNRTTRMTRIIGLLAVAAIAQTATGQSADERAVRAQGQLWQQAIAARDVDKIMTLYTPDAIFMLSHQPLLSGSAAIRKGWSDAVAIPNFAVTWQPTRVDVVSPTVANEYGVYNESFDGPDGKVTESGNYITIWHKVNGKWLVAVDAPNTMAPLPTVPTDVSDMQMAPNTAINWSPLSVPGFDPGTMIAVIHGDPSKSGDYTLRLKFPAGYKFPVHWHPGGEHLTVLSGTFQLAMGNTADWSQIKSYGPGDFLYLPARHAHFGGAQTESVIQLHGMGPFAINLGPGK